MKAIKTAVFNSAHTLETLRNQTYHGAIIFMRREFLYSFRALLAAFFAVFLLAGCSHFESEEEIALEEGAGSEQIILYQQGEDEQGVGPQQPVPQYNLSASNLSNANVQVYSVDGQPVDQRSHSSLGDGDYSVGRMSGDPSVQVFPLDDEMARSMGLSPNGVPSAIPREMPSQKPQPVEQINLQEPGPVSLLVAPEPAPMSEPAPQDDTVSLNVPGHDAIRIYFDHDSSKLDEGDIGAITTAAERHAGSPSVVSIDGHASMETSVEDPIKRKIVNLKVSMDRAFAVAKKLIEKGVPGDMIRASGWGDTAPSIAADGLDTVAASRRVEISSASGQ